VSGSFSKSKQQSTSSSQSDSSQLGFNTASSFGTGGSTSTSSSVGGSSQQIAFGDLFQQLYGGAASAAAGVDTGGISTAANQLFTGGLGFLDTLSGGNAGTAELAARASDNTARDAQLGVLQQQLGDLFNTQLLPGIKSGGVATGTLGGSRDAVQIGQAAKSVASQFSTGAASIISADQAQKDAAAGKLADVTNTGAATGLSALQSLFGLASSASTAGLQPYQILSSILGGPTTLTNSSQVSNAVANSFNTQGSQSYGFDVGNSSSSSTAQSTGSSFGISGGVGLNLQKTI
jgi:hypothetical protein